MEGNHSGLEETSLFHSKTSNVLLRNRDVSSNPEWLPSKVVIKWIAWTIYVVSWLDLNTRIRISKAMRKYYYCFLFCIGLFASFTYWNAIVWLENRFSCQLPVKNRKIFYRATLTQSFINFKYSLINLSIKSFINFK